MFMPVFAVAGLKLLPTMPLPLNVPFAGLAVKTIAASVAQSVLSGTVMVMGVGKQAVDVQVCVVAWLFPHSTSPNAVTLMVIVVSGFKLLRVRLS